MLVIVYRNKNRSQVGIGSESHYLLGQLKRILETSMSENARHLFPPGESAHHNHVPAKLSVTPLTAKNRTPSVSTRRYRLSVVLLLTFCMLVLCSMFC